MPLVSGIDITVSPVGPEGVASAARFCNVFCNVWSQLPPIAKAVLATKWKDLPATVFLTAKWDCQGGRLGQCSANGHVFHFWSLALATISDEVLAVCIAHELAHAYFFATGDPHHCGGLPDQFFNKELQYRLAEALARELGEAWGFQHARLRQWCADNHAQLSELGRE